MVGSIWAVWVGVTLIIAALCRNVGVCRYALRRTSIDGPARDRTSVIQTGDRTAEGGVPCVEVLPSTEGTPDLGLRCAGA